MNKTILKCLFCLSAIALASPNYEALAQSKGESRSVIINNGDTTVNGKKISELDKDQRARLRKEFKEMEKNFRSKSRLFRDGDLSIKRDESKDVVISRNGKESNVLVWRDHFNDSPSFDFDGKMMPELKVFKFNGDSSFGFNSDSLIKRFDFRMDGLDTNLKKRIITMHRDMVPGRPGGMTFRGNGPGIVFGRANSGYMGGRTNSSSFNYSHTDKDGISSHMDIRVSDVSKEQLKKIIGSEVISKALDVSDLTLFPNFSTGKMTLSFNINAKGLTRVNVLDSDLKQIFNDEPSNLQGNYIKQLSLPKNGVYYITINQHGSWFAKRLIKE